MILCSLSIQYIHIEYICVCVSCVFMFFWEAIFIRIAVFFMTCVLRGWWQLFAQHRQRMAEKSSAYHQAYKEAIEDRAGRLRMARESWSSFFTAVRRMFDIWYCDGLFLSWTLCLGTFAAKWFLKSWFMFYLRPRLSRRSARPERARRKPKQLRELPLSST